MVATPLLPPPSCLSLPRLLPLRTPMFVLALGMRLRAVALASLLALPPLLALSPSAPLQGPPAAEASVSVLLSLDELVAASTSVVVGTAGERKSQWEEMPTGK